MIKEFYKEFKDEQEFEDFVDFMVSEAAVYPRELQEVNDLCLKKEYEKAYEIYHKIDWTKKEI